MQRVYCGRATSACDSRRVQPRPSGDNIRPSPYTTHHAYGSRPSSCLITTAQLYDTPCCKTHVTSITSSLYGSYRSRRLRDFSQCPLSPLLFRPAAATSLPPPSSIIQPAPLMPPPCRSCRSCAAHAVVWLMCRSCSGVVAQYPKQSKALVSCTCAPVRALSV